MPNNEPRAIEPALTDEEWRAKRIDRPGTIGGEPFAGQYGMEAEVETREGGHSFLNTTEGSWGDPANLAALMALANAALPDGDPRKITHADVLLLLEDLRSHIGDEDTFGEEPEIGARRLALAAKLESLLPPDRTTYTMIPDAEQG